MNITLSSASVFVVTILLQASAWAAGGPARWWQVGAAEKAEIDDGDDQSALVRPEEEELIRRFPQVEDPATEDFPEGDTPLPAQVVEPNDAEKGGHWVRIDRTGAVSIPAMSPLGPKASDIAQISGMVGELLGPTEDKLRNGASVTGGDFRAPYAMGGMSHISPTTSYPWSSMVYIGFSSGHGSGALIDPMHVLTAAHVVVDGGTSTAHGSIVIKPGRDGATLPFGQAGWDNILVWSGWTSGGDYDHDIAVIELDFPIGGRTGWLGYGSSSSCSFFKSNTFYTAGYPDSGGITNLYYRNGTFDGCEDAAGWWYGQEVRFNNAGEPGMSGSPCYHIASDGNRYVYAVQSNGNTNHTDSPHLTSDKFSDIYSFMRGNTPSSPDLIPFSVSGPSSAARGSTISISWKALNHCRSSRTGSLSYSVRLSDNDTITTSDPWLVMGSSISFTMAANELLTRTCNVTIPSTTATGAKYIGVIITSSDSDSSNNATDDVDVLPIVVY